MKKIVTIISILFFQLAYGQVNKEKTVMHQAENETHKESDIALLWAKEIMAQTYLKKLNPNIPILEKLDLSNILVCDDTTENETTGYFSTYIGALGQNFERIDFHIYSTIKIATQDYRIKLLMRQGNTIDTLEGFLKLIEAFEFPGLLNDKSMQTMVFLYDFNFKTINPNRGISIIGTSSISFYINEGIAKNFWMEDGSLREYMRTFVGYYLDNNTKSKLNCVFALEAAGLYSYLPYCEELYYKDEEKYNSDYNLIKEKYRINGWQNYDYRNSKKETWWRK